MREGKGFRGASCAPFGPTPSGWPNRARTADGDETLTLTLWLTDRDGTHLINRATRDRLHSTARQSSRWRP